MAVLQNNIERHELTVRNVIHLDPYQSFQKGLDKHIVGHKNKALLAITGDLFDVLVEPAHKCIDLLVLGDLRFYIGIVSFCREREVAGSFKNRDLKSRRKRRGLLRMPAKFGDMGDNIEGRWTEKELRGLLRS